MCVFTDASLGCTLTRRWAIANVRNPADRVPRYELPYDPTGLEV